MRYLKTKGNPIEIDGKPYYIKYTLDVIDELQDKTKLPMSEVMTLLTYKKHQLITVKLLIKFLLGMEFEPIEVDYYSALLLTTYIEQIKFKDMPESEVASEEREPQFINVEYWFYIGKVVLGFQTDEVWQMTLGQLQTLYNQHLKCIGANKEDEDQPKKENVISF